MRIYQWVIVRGNCETFVAWASDREAAVRKMARAGHSDAWRVLRRRSVEVAGLGSVAALNVEFADKHRQ